MNSSDSENANLSSNQNNSEDGSTPEEINVFVSQLLEQMKNRFVSMGSTIISRMEDLDSRMKDLEKSVEGLMDASGTRSEAAAAAAETNNAKSSSQSTSTA